MTKWFVIACVVVAGAAAAGCAPSLVAVKTTAGLGAQLATFEGAFDRSARYCHYTDHINAPDPRCAGLDADLENWRTVNRALVGYAAALAAMANDARDTGAQSDIATALAASAKLGERWSAVLDANLTSGVSSGVATLIAGITGVYRRERLGDTIRDADDALQAIARGLDANIVLLDRATQNLVTMIGDTMASVQIGSSPAADRAGLTIALASVRVELAGHREQLASYQRAVAAFAKAHGNLRSKATLLGDRQADLELLRMIATDVAAIARSVDTALTRPPQPEPAPAPEE